MFIKLTCRLFSCLLLLNHFGELTRRFIDNHETARQFIEQVLNHQKTRKPAGKFYEHR